jgi:hypothetical protein
MAIKNYKLKIKNELPGPTEKHRHSCRNFLLQASRAKRGFVNF